MNVGTRGVLNLHFPMFKVQSCISSRMNVCTRGVLR